NREAKRAAQVEAAKDKFLASARHLKNGVSGIGMLIASPFGFSANALGAALDLAGISKKATFGTLIAANIGIGLSPADAGIYHPMMEGYSPVALNQSCTPDMLKMSAANIVYARVYGQDARNPIEQHAAKTMLLADRHDVPAI